MGSLKFLAVVSLILLPCISGQTCRGDVVGKIRNYKELSGLVASHRNPGIFYSVEDSQNDELVYAFYENGTLLGKIRMENVRQYDFEDIALTPGPNQDGDFIYVADIGNNWRQHCRGINAPNKKIYMFREPSIELLSSGGEATIPESDVTTIELHDPRINNSSQCESKSQIDTESMFIDSVTQKGYLVQKIHPSYRKCCYDFDNLTIFKFSLPSAGHGNFIKVLLENASSIPIERVHLLPKTLTGSAPIWPLDITAGDISRDGTILLLRSYNEVRMWTRDPSSSKMVESILSENDGIKLDICSEHQGEAVAIKPDKTGYYTTTELSKKNSSHLFAPIYYYSIPDATTRNLNPTAHAQGYAYQITGGLLGCLLVFLVTVAAFILHRRRSINQDLVRETEVENAISLNGIETRQNHLPIVRNDNEASKSSGLDEGELLVLHT